MTAGLSDKRALDVLAFLGLPNPSPAVSHRNYPRVWWWPIRWSSAPAHVLDDYLPGPGAWPTEQQAWDALEAACLAWSASHD